MQITNEINSALIVANRFADAHCAAENAVNAVNQLYFKLFADMVTPEQKKQVADALEMLRTITSATTMNAAIDYVKNMGE